MDETAIRGEWATDDVYAIMVEGDFDLALRDHAIAVTGRALDEEPRALLIDVKRCTFLDSTAIAVIVGARRRALDEGVAFALVGHNPTVDRMIELTGLSAELAVLADREAALAALG